MPERKEKKETKVNDFTEAFHRLTGLVRENYLLRLEFGLSFLEESQKLADAQVEQFLATQKDYAEQAKATFERFPREAASFWNDSYLKSLNGNFDRLSGIQRDYINLVRNISEKFAKDTVRLTQKTAEKAFSPFEEYLRPFQI
jgi:hypothetical protein